MNSSCLISEKKIVIKKIRILRRTTDFFGGLYFCLKNKYTQIHIWIITRIAAIGRSVVKKKLKDELFLKKAIVLRSNRK